MDYFKTVVHFLCTNFKIQVPIGTDREVVRSAEGKKSEQRQGV